MLKWLVTLIAALLVLGLLTPWLNRLGLGRLPGDVRLRAARGLNGAGVASPDSARRINELYAYKCYQWWSFYALLLLSKAYCP